MCGTLGAIGSVVNAPFKWIGDATQWAGERTGIKPLEEAGRFTSDFTQDPRVQNLSGAAALTGGMYMGAEALPYVMTGFETGTIPFTEENMILKDMLAQRDAFTAAGAAGGGAGAATISSDLNAPGAYRPEGVQGYTQAAPAVQKAAESPWYSWDNLKMPATLLGINALSQGLGAYAQQQSQNDLLGKWREYAFPNAAAVNAQTNTMMSGLAEDELRLRRKMQDEAARRGMGSASGLRSQANTDLGKASMQTRAKALQDIIKWQNTPYSPPPLNQTQGWGERMANMIGDTTGLFSGMYLYDWMKNRR